MQVIQAVGHLEQVQLSDRPSKQAFPVARKPARGRAGRLCGQREAPSIVEDCARVVDATHWTLAPRGLWHPLNCQEVIPLAKYHLQSNRATLFIDNALWALEVLHALKETHWSACQIRGMLRAEARILTATDNCQTLAVQQHVLTWPASQDQNCEHWHRDRPL